MSESAGACGMGGPDDLAQVPSLAEARPYHSHPRPLYATALLTDQRRRWEQGERIVVEEYLREQPALGAESETILDLLYHEILLREARGETPQLEEYLRRFPQFPEQLRLHFEVHAALL